MCQPRISKASDRRATGSRTTGMTPFVKLTSRKYTGATATSTRVFSKPADQRIRIPCRHNARGQWRSASEAKCGVLDLVFERHGNAGIFSVRPRKCRCESSKMEKPDQRRARWKKTKGAGTETLRSMIHPRDAIGSGPKATRKCFIFGTA